MNSNGADGWRQLNVLIVLMMDRSEGKGGRTGGAEGQLLENKGEGSKFCRSLEDYNENMMYEICLFVIL